jgi:hypothetical protein
MKVFEQEMNIERLIDYAETEKLWIPEFQRPFVWDKNQIRLLIDSLFHNYTISSILLWEGAAELARRRVGGNIKEIKIPEDNTTEKVIYLLDGQQRTTALMLAFTDKAVYQGTNTKKKTSIDIYWDTEYDGPEPESRWVLGDEKIPDSENGDNNLRLEELSQEEIFRKYKARFVKIKHAYNWSKTVASILSAMGNDTLFVAYLTKVQEIQKNVLNRRVHDIEQPGILEQVLEVFERINTKNTRLSIFDIMVAKTYRKIEDNFFDLRTYLSVLNYEGNVKTDYFQNLADDGLDLDGVKGKIDDGDMLAIITILLKQEYLQTSVLKLKTDELICNVKLVHDRFHQILATMKQQFFIEEAELFKYQPMLKFLAGFYGHFGTIDLEKQTFLSKWFWNTLIKNRYPGAQNERIAKDLKHAKENTLKVTLEKMMTDNTRSFLDIQNAKPESSVYFDAYKSASSQQIYRAMLLLLKSKNARDFYNGLVPAKNATIQYTLEEHHIFPDNSAIGKQIKQKYSDHRYNDIINNIANIALLTKETNNNRIKAKKPSEYITAFEQEYQQQGKINEFNSILESQFITSDMIYMLKADDFEGFLYLRTQELLKQINKLCDLGC